MTKQEQLQAMLATKREKPIRQAISNTANFVSETTELATNVARYANIELKSLMTASAIESMKLETVAMAELEAMSTIANAPVTSSTAKENF